MLEVYAGNNWTEVDPAHTLANVTLHEAETHPQASPNAIASLVRHPVFWNGAMARRARAA